MSDPFVGEIKIFAGTFAPFGWALCDGQLLPIAQNTALFSILGTTYGGDGRTTFGLPDLHGAAPMHPGNAPFLTSRVLGEGGGLDEVTLSAPQIPPHTHQLRASAEEADRNGPVDRLLADGEQMFHTGFNGTMHPTSLESVGGQAHNNMQPFLALHFVIALVGVYPSRN